MRYFFRVAYDGAGYAGWQRQVGAVSVQQVLEESLSTLLRAPCTVVGAGRTDAGVHARRQGVHFVAADGLDLPVLEKSFNAILPRDIGVFGLTTVPDDFSARFSATGRTYKYYMSTIKEPLEFRHRWQLFYRDLDWNRIQESLPALLGCHDFSSFCASGSNAENAVCTIRRAEIETVGPRRTFLIEADRFVYRMVRSIVGTLVAIGRGSLQRSMVEVIDACDRNKAGPTAPAWALVLEDVAYKGVV